MTATDTTLRVPVRTWREKALLAAAIAGRMPRLEGIDTKAGFIEELLLSESHADRLLDEHFEAWAYVEALQSVLRALRGIEPGPDAYLEVPSGIDIQRYLGEQVDYIGETNVDEMRGEHPSKREWAEALIAGVDLRDGLAGGDA
jgi:hypothetical protein